MTPTREDLRHLVEEIGEEQVPDAVALMRQLAASREPVNELPFAGVVHSGHGELAERGEDILREELGGLTVVAGR